MSVGRVKLKLNYVDYTCILDFIKCYNAQLLLFTNLFRSLLVQWKLSQNRE